MGALLVLAVALSLVSASSAAGAVTRIRVDWTASNPPDKAQRVHDYAPQITVFEGGGPVGRYGLTGCGFDYGCSAEAGFRWGEENRDDGGVPHRVSFVDEQPARRRQICFEVGHPDQPEAEVDPTYSVTVTVTDPSGVSRTYSKILRKGQVTDLDCSPVFRPKSPRGLGARARPPKWWVQGVRLLKSRGGRCKSSKTRRPSRHPVTGRRAGTFTTSGVYCEHSIPRRLFAKFGGNPDSPNPSESCSSSVSRGNPDGDEYSYSCWIFSVQGRRKRPSLSSWSCERRKFFEEGRGQQRGFLYGAWIGQRDKRSSKRRIRTLARCLARPPRR